MCRGGDVVLLRVGLQLCTTLLCVGGWRATGISPDKQVYLLINGYLVINRYILYLSPYISLHLLIPPYISSYLLTSPHIPLYLFQILSQAHRVSWK